MTRNDSSPVREIQLPDQRAAILARADVAQQITTDWFDPDFWEDQARPVSTGGRGGAWFVHHRGEDWVLRHYLRGGFPAKLSRQTFVFYSAQKIRSFTEFRLLDRLRELGLPVPKAIAAYCVHTVPGFYQASILLDRIDNARPLMEAAATNGEALWFQVGQTIRRFHDEGLNHVDLNVDNILVAGEKIYLIDFDRCQMKGASDSGHWKQANLERLRRSIKKRSHGVIDEKQQVMWESLEKGYRAG